MTRLNTVRAEYVEVMPKILRKGVFYISEKYRTASHLCCCGCGTKVVTPLKPGRWRLQTTDAGITLSPSVGNWSSACQSHYFIENGRVRWAQSFTPQQIARNRTRDEAILEEVYRPKVPKFGFCGRMWRRIKEWLS